jgi:hypothetical protein
MRTNASAYCQTNEGTKVAEKFSVIIHYVSKSFCLHGLLPSTVVVSNLGIDVIHQDENVSFLFLVDR